MRLNLHIIHSDLKDMTHESRLASSPIVRTLEYVCVYQPGMAIRKQALYIGVNSDLDRISDASLNCPINLVCVGKPSQRMLQSSADILWFPEESNLWTVAEKLQDLFIEYNDAHFALMDALAKDKPIQQLIRNAMRILNRPFYIWTQHGEILISHVGVQKELLPDDYVTYEIGQLIPNHLLDEWNAGLQDGRLSAKTVASRQPYILYTPDVLSYRALNANIFVKDKVVATLSVDEIGQPFDNKDYALIDFLADVLSTLVKRSTGVNLSATTMVSDLLRTLLDGGSVDHGKLRNALRQINWTAEDIFVVQVAKPLYPPYSPITLSRIASNMCSQLPYVIYEVFDGGIAFIANVSRAQVDAKAACERTRIVAENMRYKVLFGCSIAFNNIEDVHGYFRQAQMALELSPESQSSSENIVFFDDCILGAIKRNICDHAIPEVICPSCLMELMMLDEAEGTDYTLILRTYLDNNMSTSETARMLYMHRNTLISRLQKIRSILGDGLSDPDKRLVISLALRVMEETSLMKRITPRP